MSQPQTAPITKNGTSETSSPKKRGRQKGWTKAKAEAKKNAEAAAILKGNSDFNLNDPEVKKTISETVIDMAVFSPEDAALDAELDKLAAQRPQVTDQGGASEVPVQKAKEFLEHLSGHTDGEYQPAKTMADLTEQVHVAKSVGADSIDATEVLFKQVFRHDFDKIKVSPGYGIYHDIRVYLVGMFEKMKHLDKQTMEQKLFPKK